MSRWPAVGPWQSRRPTWTATSCPRFTSRTISGPIGCCIIGRGPASSVFASSKGQKSLTTPNSKVVGRDSFKGMGVDFGDLNGDGRLDFFVSNIAAEYALEESHFVFLGTGETSLMRRGIAPLRRPERALGLPEGLGMGREARRLRQRRGSRSRPGRRLRQGDDQPLARAQELAMGNDEFLTILGTGRGFGR